MSEQGANRDNPKAALHAMPVEAALAAVDGRLTGLSEAEAIDRLNRYGPNRLQAYAHYYNDIRTHRSLAKDAPVSRPVQRTGAISSHVILGGLHHHYVRI